MITGFFLGTVFDLNISKALTGFSSDGKLSISVGLVPKIMEVIGYWSSPLFCSVALAIVEIDMRKKLKEKIRMAFFIATVLIEAGLMFYASSKTIKPIVGKLYIGHYILITFMAIVLTFILRFFIEHLNKKKLESIFKPALFSVIAVVVIVVCFEVIKLTCGRIRFRDLIAAGSLDAYTPWYRPNWFSGSKSFPSGHMGNATALMTLPLWFEKKLPKNKITAMYAVILIWNFLLAFSRICAGAHYLTDVIFGFMLGSILVNIVYHYYRKTEKHVDKAPAEAHSGEKPEIS